jgi:hypothetical protein
VGLPVRGEADQGGVGVEVGAQLDAVGARVAELDIHRRRATHSWFCLRDMAEIRKILKEGNEGLWRRGKHPVRPGEEREQAYQDYAQV